MRDEAYWRISSAVADVLQLKNERMFIAIRVYVDRRSTENDPRVPTEITASLRSAFLRERHHCRRNEAVISVVP
jgi:hypothetical protein